MYKYKDKDLQVIIGWLLRIGVALSVFIVLTGGVIYLYKHSHELTNYAVFVGVPSFVYPASIINGIHDLHGQSIIQAGIILLIATPVLRVIFSVIGFLLEKDYLYTIIALVVLLIIAISMLTGHAG